MDIKKRKHNKYWSDKSRLIAGVALSLLMTVGMISCEDFVAINPPASRLVKQTVFQSDETAEAAVTAIYHQMQNTGFASGRPDRSVTSLAGLSADELVTYSVNGTTLPFNVNEIVPANASNLSLWSLTYQTIYMSNSVLEGLAASTKVSTTMRKQLEGEAKFIRAFCYFYLVNLYGDVPVLLTTDYRTNAIAARAPSDEVYAQIIDDLIDAKELLAIDYSISDGERTRPNRSAAAALLARTYLYRQDWVNAEQEASNVIEDPTYALVGLNEVFLANSQEAIWQLIPVEPTVNTWEGNFFILNVPPTAAFTQSTMALSVQTISTFETDDGRWDAWVGAYIGAQTYYYPFKYKVKSGAAISEYSMVIRLAELYLIRAEARARQGEVTAAQADIDAIRLRAELPGTAADSEVELLSAIAQERRVELFTEWGHRWLDLKRTNQADVVLDPVKDLWQPTDVLYPIPQQERANDPNLTQNDGYGAN